MRGLTPRVRNVLNRLRLDLQPDNAFIGRIPKGFNFLGCLFSLGALGVATKT